jgi:Fe-S oxidoreductase
MTSQATINDKVMQGMSGINNGPLPLNMAMEMCAKCGMCASQCPVYYGSDDKSLNPAVRSDLVRKLYKRYGTPTGRLLGKLFRDEGFTVEDVKKWANWFYQCTGCRRCAQFCPMGIDNSVITRKARALLNSLGYTPDRLIKVINTSLQTGNTDGANPLALVDTVKFLEEEMEEEHGIKIAIPVDKVGAKIFFVPPSGDVLVYAESLMGIAKIFHVTGEDWTLSSTAFDGANYGLFTGDDEAMKKENLRYVDEAKRLQCQTMMMGECGHAHRVMKCIMEKSNWWGKLPFNITNILQYTADKVEKGIIKLDKSKTPYPVTYHDPCNLAKSSGIVKEPRVIMNAACSDFREMTPHGADNWCCGGGGGLSSMDSTHEFRMTVSGKKKVEQIRASQAKYVAAPCSNCKKQLLELVDYHKLDVEIIGVHGLVSRTIILES